MLRHNEFRGCRAYLAWSEDSFRVPDVPQLALQPVNLLNQLRQLTLHLNQLLGHCNPPLPQRHPCFRFADPTDHRFTSFTSRIVQT
jgi:hypothetical protein